MDNMEKNYLKYTCIWALIILAGLLLMYSFCPLFTVGEHVMRRVDLLDVRTQKDIAERTGQFASASAEGETCICGYLPCGYDVH